MSIADRALAAHAAEEEAKRLQKEAANARRRGIAVDAIGRVLESFGMDTTDLDVVIEPDYRFKRWTVTIPVDEDCSLVITSEPDDEIVSTRLRPVDELYRDIPPGGDVGRGTYGCYGLDKYSGLEGINSLADLGRAIAKVREARVAWCKKHGAPVDGWLASSQESEMNPEDVHQVFEDVRKEVEGDGTA